MIYFWRLIFSLMIALTVIIFNGSHVYSLADNYSKITASDFLKLGVNQMQQENYHSAIEYLNLAIEMQNDYTAAYKNRCLAYLELENYNQAITDCTQAINLTPDDSDSYLNRGLAKYRQGNYLHAIADYHQAIILKPNNFRAHYNQGLAFAGKGNYSQAIISYNRALTQIESTNKLLLADIYNDRGLAYFNSQNLAAARQSFNLAIRLYPDNYRAFFNRGCLYEYIDNNLQAIHDFSQVIKLKPSHALAYVNRGLTNYNLGFYQKAIADLQQASLYFQKQGENLAYEQTLYLLKVVQTEISSLLEVV